MTTTDEVLMPEPDVTVAIDMDGIPRSLQGRFYTADKVRDTAIAYADAKCQHWKSIAFNNDLIATSAIDEINMAKTERDALAERVKALEADARRYRWLRGRMFVRRNAAVPDRYGLDEYLLSEGIDEQDDADFIDAAIDAATEET